MKKLIALLPAVAVLAACSSPPTSSSAAAPHYGQADERMQPSPQDTASQRVPNLFGAGN